VPRRIVNRPHGAAYDIHVLGVGRTPLSDLYHRLLLLPWPVTFLLITVVFLTTNAGFALAYCAIGGVAHAQPGSFWDAFCFSVQTMGTIGYGAMYPESAGANLLVVAEAIVSFALTALMTGLVFAKFSRPTARVVFSEKVVITPIDGVPTLVLRVGNARGNAIVDAQFRVVATLRQTTREGHTMYRMRDLHLARDRALSLARSLQVMHAIGPDSPLHGHDPASLAQAELEVQVLMLGLDDVAMSTVHATRTYMASHIVWGARLADVISEADDGAMVLDLRRFHELVPSEPTPDFPYPRA
jgi:inward rectifier potassium channel